MNLNEAHFIPNESSYRVNTLHTHMTQRIWTDMNTPKNLTICDKMFISCEHQSYDMTTNGHMKQIWSEYEHCTYEHKFEQWSYRLNGVFTRYELVAFIRMITTCSNVSIWLLFIRMNTKIWRSHDMNTFATNFFSNMNTNMNSVHTVCTFQAHL